MKGKTNGITKYIKRKAAARKDNKAATVIQRAFRKRKTKFAARRQQRSIEPGYNFLNEYRKTGHYAKLVKSKVGAATLKKMNGKQYSTFRNKYGY